MSAMPAGLDALLTRYSVGPKHLVEPAPGDEQLALMVQAALHAPDHAELVPYRFKLVRGASKEDMAALFADAARAAGKGEEGAALDAERALKPPLTVAVVARIDLGHPLVPAHEQWAAVGGAIANFLGAAHAMGFGGKMLSGAKVRDAAIAAAFCEPGETLLGWIALGTPVRKPAGPSRKPDPGQVLIDWHRACK